MQLSILRWRFNRPLFGLAILATVLVCYGQGTQALITGVVRDPSGAVVPGTVVRATNTATNVFVQTVTNASGIYTLDFMLPGQYTITAEKNGFKRFERSGVTVRVSDRLSLDILLEMGQITERVVVQAGAPLLETASASLGTVVDNRRIAELPLMHGNPLMLQLMAPGLTFNGNVAWTRPFDSAASESSFNGAQLKSTEYLLDGVPDTYQRASAYTPSVEFVQEYKVETATYDASQGHSGGAWVNLSLKSGTNQLHGSVYDYLQNPVLNANQFFNNKAGVPKPWSYWNRWGGAAGGPIQKNKLFWFFGYEGIRDAQIENSVALTVPTAAERTGDFSQLLALGSQYVIYDPATTTDLGNGRLSRQPFPGNIIPPGRISPIGQKFVNYYPLPNQTGGADGRNNYYYGKAEPDTYYSFSGRVDEVINDRQRLYGHFVDSNRHQGPYRYYFPGANGQNLYYKNRGGMVDYTYTLNAQTVLNVRYGYTRFLAQHFPQTEGFDLSSVGMPSYIQAATPPLAHYFPRIAPSGFQALNTESQDYTIGNIHSIYGGVSRSQGKHLLRLGADFRVYQQNAQSLSGENGTFNFGGYLNGPLDNSPSAPLGPGIAGLLLGLPSGGGLTLNDSYAASTHYCAVYLQDDWKITSKLTLNLGIRYEYEGPIVERYNRSVRGFDFVDPNPIQAAAAANYAKNPIPQVPASQFQTIGGLTYAGVNGQPRGLYGSFTHDFAPRFGLAYSINPRTVIRAGYGVFFDSVGITTQTPILTGYSQTTNIIPTLDNGVTFIASLANPFPNGFLQPTRNTAGLSTYVGNSISFFDTKPYRPYNQRWSVDVQRELSSNIMVDIAYVGSKGVHLFQGTEDTGLSSITVSKELDGIPNQYLSTSPVRDQKTIDMLTLQVPNPFYGLLPGTGLAGKTVSVSQLLRPYPQFTGMTMNTTGGYSWYHALQSRIQKRLANGFTLMGAWTWSKNMEAMYYLNAMDPVPARNISPNDRTHRFSVNGIYELPFGHGRRYGASASTAVNKLIGGWQLEGIYQYQTGQPLGFGDYIYYGDPKDIALPASQRTVDHWFNTANFERNSKNQLSYHLRTVSLLFSNLRSAPINYLDISTIKNTNLTERFILVFRAEAFNALNHTVFEAPDTTPTDSTFGQVSSAKDLPRKFQFSLAIRF